MWPRSWKYGEPGGLHPFAHLALAAALFAVSQGLLLVCSSDADKRLTAGFVLMGGLLGVVSGRVGQRRGTALEWLQAGCYAAALSLLACQLEDPSALGTAAVFSAVTWWWTTRSPVPHAALAGAIGIACSAVMWSCEPRPSLALLLTVAELLAVFGSYHAQRCRWLTSELAAAGPAIPLSVVASELRNLSHDLRNAQGIQKANLIYLSDEVEMEDEGKAALQDTLNALETEVGLVRDAMERLTKHCHRDDVGSSHPSGQAPTQ